MSTTSSIFSGISPILFTPFIVTFAIPSTDFAPNAVLETMSDIFPPLATAAENPKTAPVVFAIALIVPIAIGVVYFLATAFTPLMFLFAFNPNEVKASLLSKLLFFNNLASFDSFPVFDVCDVWLSVSFPKSLFPSVPSGLDKPLLVFDYVFSVIFTNGFAPAVLTGFGASSSEVFPSSEELSF